MTNKMYIAGANFERRVKKHMEDAGWACWRSPGSKSPADVVCIKGAYEKLSMVLLIQCQLDLPFSAYKKRELLLLAKKLCAFPLLAYREGRKIQFQYVEKI